MQTLIKVSGTSLRIVAEELHGHWSARSADPSANETYGGVDAMDAIRRLIENSPHWGVTVDDFEPDWDRCTSTRIEMVFVGQFRNVCQDCGGSGKYVGLNVVEACATCGGKRSQ